MFTLNNRINCELGYGSKIPDQSFINFVEKLAPFVEILVFFVKIRMCRIVNAEIDQIKLLLNDAQGDIFLSEYLERFLILHLKSTKFVRKKSLLDQVN